MKYLRERGVHSRPIPRRVLRTEHQTTGNTAQTTKSDQSRTRERSRPLSTDVIRLVCHARGDIRIGSCYREEHARVPGGVALGETHHGQADDAEQGVEDEDRCADTELVAEPGSAVHHDTGEDVGWSDEALGRADAETHAFHQDDGKEVGDGVGDSGQTAVEPVRKNRRW